MSAKGSRRMARVASIGCILCCAKGLGETPAEVHHLKEECGAGQRQSDALTIGLCPEHHRGTTGLHGLGRRAFERTYGLTELDLLGLVILALEP